VLYPRGRISPLQERQMTCVADDNVFPVAVAGTFDDCQLIMKAIFADVAFRDRLSLGAVNSVNRRCEIRAQRSLGLAYLTLRPIWCTISDTSLRALHFRRMPSRPCLAHGAFAGPRTGWEGTN
jgi:hypothetical protein